MNRLILFSADLEEKNLAVLHDRRAQHIRSVLGSKIGDSLKFGVANGESGTAQVLSDNGTHIYLQLEYSQAPPISFLPCTLVLALPRPKVARRLIQAICTLGVSELHLINAYRVDKSYWKSHYLEEDQLREQLLLGMEQSGSTLMPEVHQHSLFRPFAEDVFPKLIGEKTALIAHPYSETKCPVALNSPSVLVVGPEGGFTQFEVDLLSAQGALPVSIGNRILRVETAVPALLGRLYELS